MVVDNGGNLHKASEKREYCHPLGRDQARSPREKKSANETPNRSARPWPTVPLPYASLFSSCVSSSAGRIAFGAREGQEQAVQLWKGQLDEPYDFVIKR